MVVRIQINQGDLRRVQGRINGLQKLPVKMGEAGFEFSKVVAESIKRQFLIDAVPGGSKRIRTSERIKARKISKNKSIVVIPKSAHDLDTTRPRFVQLKPGSRMSKWARKYYDGTPARRRKSKVFFTKRGVPKGKIFITRHPFVNKGFNRVKGQLNTLLKRKLKETLKGG